MSIWKTIFRWLLGMFGLAVVAVVAIVYVSHLQQERRERLRRDSRKVRLGDSPSDIRLRLGVPDTVWREGKYTWWFYGRPNNDPSVVGIYDTTPGPTVWSIWMNGSALWTPEDGLDPSTYASVDETVQRFTKVLGKPCRMTYDDDSTQVTYLFEISAAELKADSVYGELAAKKNVAYPFRFLNVSLKRGKSVENHGWTVARGGFQSCGKIAP